MKNEEFGFGFRYTFKVLRSSKKLRCRAVFEWKKKKKKEKKVSVFVL